jgi:hypothetical protein
MRCIDRLQSAVFLLDLESDQRRLDEVEHLGPRGSQQAKRVMAECVFPPDDLEDAVGGPRQAFSPV